jgi:hypothetical protein
LPPASPSLYCSKGGCSAYHANVGGLYTFQVIDYSTDHPGINSVISHEIYESATDPDGSGYHGVGSEAEVGDFCGGQNYFLDNQSIQKCWGQSECACLPATH